MSGSAAREIGRTKLIIGFFLGLGAASYVISIATPDCGGQIPCEDWIPYAAAGVIFVGGFVLGGIFVAIVGSMTTFVIGGAAIAVVVAIVNGLWLRVPGLVLVGLSAWLVGHGQMARYETQRFGYYGGY